MKTDRHYLLRAFGVVAFYGGLVVLGQIAGGWALDRLDINLMPSTQGTIHEMVLVAMALYVLLLALPFMPGVEIGFGLMVMLGPSICFLVYAATVIALALAFCVGRLLPPGVVIKMFRYVGLTRASEHIARLAPLSVEDRLHVLFSQLPGRHLTRLLRHRYLAVAILLNIPGNAVIGGGGGIALTAGLTRLFTFPGFLLTVLLAVSPLPLAFYLTGGFR